MSISTTKQEAALDRRDAILLASAWAITRANSIGARSLLLKGPLATELGLRAAKVSADVDLLVEPSRVNEVVAELTSAGWHERRTVPDPRVVENHSITLIHENWPIDLDVHLYWPGFLIAPERAFEILWDSRYESSLAGVGVSAPDLISSALILALHALRRPLEQTTKDTVDGLADAVRTILGESAGTKIGRRAGELGALQTAKPFLELLGVHVAEDRQPDEALLRWQLKARTKGNMSAWLVLLSSTRPIRVPGVALRALFPSPAQLRVQHPELAPGPKGIVLGWVRRWRSGLSELPRAYREVKRFRSAKKRGN